MVAPSISSNSKLSTRPTPRNILITCSYVSHWGQNNFLSVLFLSLFRKGDILLLKLSPGLWSVLWNGVSTWSACISTLEVGWNLSSGLTFTWIKHSKYLGLFCYQWILYIVPQYSAAKMLEMLAHLETWKRHRPRGENPPPESFSRWGQDAEFRIAL